MEGAKQDVEEKYWKILWLNFLRSLDDIKIHITSTGDIYGSQITTATLAYIHNEFAILTNWMTIARLQTAEFQPSTMASPQQTNLRFTVNKGQSSESSSSGEQNLADVMHDPRSHVYSAHPQSYGDHNFMMVPPVQFEGIDDIIEESFLVKYGDWHELYLSQPMLPFLPNRRPLSGRPRKNRCGGKPNINARPGESNIVLFVQELDKFEGVYNSIEAKCLARELIAEPKISLVNRKEEPSKKELKKTEINWSSYEIVMPSTKWIQPKNTSIDGKHNSFDSDFPDLIPATGLPKIVNDLGTTGEPTKNFAAVLLRNLTDPKTKDCLPSKSESHIKLVEKTIKPVTRTLSQKGPLIQSMKTSGKEKTATTYGQKEKKEIDKDGWEMVRGKYKRDDKVKFEKNSDLTFMGDEGCSNPFSIADPDLDEMLINEEELRKDHELEEEKKMLTKKIHDLESSEFDEEIEGDDMILCDPHLLHLNYVEFLKSIPWAEKITEIEKLSHLLPTASGDMAAATVEQFEELVTHYPGRALELHLKLSSRSEKKDSEDKNLARRLKADEKRQKLLTAKAAKMRELVQKVEEVKAQQYLLAEERKHRLDLKLKKAEENRQEHLRIIRRKAHDEEEKLKEIAFINELEAQNRRHESLALRQEHEERIQNILEERQRKVDEKAAKEAAVEERRRVLEAERQEKLVKMQEKRRRKEESIGRKQMEKEKERMVIAREKAREREVRLKARHAAQLATAEELQKKIQQKQESSARRHEENIEHIRQKASETASLRTVVIDEELCPGAQDEKSKPESRGKSDEFNVTYDKGKNRKRAKKIKMRVSQRGAEAMEKLQIVKRAVKEKEVTKVFDILSSISQKELRLWENEEIWLFEQQVTEITTLLKRKSSIQDVFRSKGGFIVMSKTFSYFDEAFKEKRIQPPVRKLLVSILNLYQQAVSHDTVVLMNLCSNGDLFMLMDSLRHKINAVLEGRKIHYGDSIMHTLSIIFSEFVRTSEDLMQSVSTICSDILSYLLCTGLIVRIIDVIKLVTEGDQKFNFLIAPSLEFFSTLSKLPTKNTEYMKMLESSDLMGVVSLLYCSLQDYVPRASLPPFTTSTMRFLLSVAHSDIKLFQSILGAEGMYLQLRHIASYLLGICILEDRHMTLLHIVIEIIGYFSVHNLHNQMLLQSGQMPTVLQQLVSLPFRYFCEPALSRILFPTLVACCHTNPTNKSLLENELSYELVDNFLNSPAADTVKLIQIFREWE